MKHFIQRDYERSEHDDFALNVQHKLDNTHDAIPLYTYEGDLVGWYIQSRYE